MSGFLWLPISDHLGNTAAVMWAYVSRSVVARWLDGCRWETIPDGTPIGYSPSHYLSTYERDL